MKNKNHTQHKIRGFLNSGDKSPEVEELCNKLENTSLYHQKNETTTSKNKKMPSIVALIQMLKITMVKLFYLSCALRNINAS